MKDFLLINNIDDLIDLSRRWTSKNFAFDTEFTNLKYMTQELIGLSIYDERNGIPAVFIQFNFSSTYIEKIADPNGGRKKLDVTRKYSKTDAIEISEALPYLRKIFEGANCICATAKVEWKIASKYGFANWVIEDDVNMMSYLLNVDNENGLKANAKRELKLEMPSYVETVGQKVDNINWNLVDFYKYAEYGARDAWATYKLRDIYLPRISEFPALLKCYKSLEIPLTYEVATSEMRGVEIDVEYLREMSKVITEAINEAEQEIFDEIGCEFNLSSPTQLAEILFDRLGYPSGAVSEKTGKRSVNEDTLKELAFKGYDVADDILDYRKLEKLKSTYIDSIPLMVDKDGRLRGNLNQLGTATGRFSSSKPNLQNQPNNKRFPIKRAFVARKGYKLLNLDWSTIEIRIMAHESGDEKLIELLNAGRDIHQETSNAINGQFGLTLDRNQGKTINFAVLYLMGADSLMYTLNKSLKGQYKEGKITMAELKKLLISKQVAQQIIDGYFNTYTGFTQFIKNEVANSTQTGWVWTLGGRRRPVHELRSKKTFGFGRRKTVNTIIQGGAGDLMKLGVIKLAKMYREKRYDATTLLYIHDEYVIEVREDQAERCYKDCVEIMTNIFPSCRVPILCEGGIFDDWGGLKGGAKPKKKKSGMSVKRMMALKLIGHGRR